MNVKINLNKTNKNEDTTEIPLLNKLKKYMVLFVFLSFQDKSLTLLYFFSFFSNTCIEHQQQQQQQQQ
jgi:hypothetical protein